MAVVVVAFQLIDGTRWLAVFAPLLVLLVVWFGQAVHAHRRAIALGATPGGEVQIAAFLPFALTALTLFWLIGGRHGSPAATVEAYMQAWMDERPVAASELFVASMPATQVADQWTRTLEKIRRLLDNSRTRYGEQSGLDPARPFNSLRVTPYDGPGAGPEYLIEIVRSERFATTVLGVIPTAAQRTVVVGQVLAIRLAEDTSGTAWLPSSSWRITGVDEMGLQTTP